MLRDFEGAGGGAVFGSATAETGSLDDWELNQIQNNG
jgi:hypothetical protein